MKELAIIGAGGFGREVRMWAKDRGFNNPVFYVSDHIAAPPNRPLSQLDIERSMAVVAIGNPKARAEVVARLRHGQRFTDVIHPTAIIRVDSGDGTILCPYAVVTCDCIIGNHLHMNLHSDIGHDCIIGDYVTLAPSARVSGNCKIGDGVYIGTNAVIREGVTIAPWSIIGANSLVLHDITEAGTYVGSPVKRIK